MNPLEIVLFVIGAGFGLLWFSVIVLPVFYGVPKSLYWIMRGRLRMKALFVYLVTPGIWTVLLVVAVVLLGILWPRVNGYLYNSAGFFFGQWFGVIGALIRSVTKAGRQDLREDFLSFTARHQR
jgi:hypothetical protein